MFLEDLNQQRNPHAQNMHFHKRSNLRSKNLDIFHWSSSPIIAAPKWSSWVYVDACGVNGWLSEWEMKILWPDPNSTNIYICSVCKDWSTSVGCDCGTSSIWYAKLILYLTDKMTFPLGFLITSRDGPEKEGVKPKTLMNLWWSDKPGEREIPKNFLQEYKSGEDSRLWLPSELAECHMQISSTNSRG